MPQWLVYALGGGFGHLTRACALARAAAPKYRVRILTNSPYAGMVCGALPELDVITLDPGITAQQSRIDVIRQIELAEPDCLVVDTFPRGLGGELVEFVPRFAGPRVLVQRDLNPLYAAAFDLSAFIANCYNLVLVPGDLAGVGIVTAPWLVRSCDETFTRERARIALGLRDDKPCVIVCAAGNREELDWYGSVAADLVESPMCDVRCIAPVCPATCPRECWLFYWPAIELYAAADVVVGGAGYNTIYECRALGIPLIARAWPRKYDRQGLRASLAGITVVDDPGEAAMAAVSVVGTARQRTPFHNGATDAVKLIEQLLHPIRVRDITSM